ncbi:MAG: magnesium/cobalt transporter CorA [Methanobacteriota archaeon]|nr:MAG: magnesium/cobalt transporter CorA [Euryarchaeota archaeon]
MRSAFRLPRHHSKKTGTPPGTLIYTGEKKVDKARISIMEYDSSEYSERVVEDFESCLPIKEKPTVTWLNVVGLSDIGMLERLGKEFGLHPLVLEDILNVHQRPKLEDFGDFVFIVLRMACHDGEAGELRMEQMSIILTEDCVITFQETEANVFDDIRKRIREPKGKMRRMGADYLAYALIDAIVDGYFIILDYLGQRTEALEMELVSDPVPETLHEIYRLKRDMIFLRRSVWPLREAISALDRGGSSLIREGTELYLRDLYDHTIRVIDAVESIRDVVTGMLDVYLSSVSNKMNEVMKVLTIIATIFIPLSFLAGVYGMNFEDMPELGWAHAYPVLLAAMAIVGIAMVVYFRMK